MDVDTDYRQVSGKVLLYTSRDPGAHPTMTITHDTVSELPPVLLKLSRRFSPIRSKSFYNIYCTLFKCTVQSQTVVSTSLKIRCGPLRADSLRPFKMMILYHGMPLLMVMSP